MKNIPKFSVKRPVTIIMCVCVILILGVISFMNLTTDLYPKMNLPYALVMTPYPMASPDSVEELVTIPIEEQLSTISGVNNITSTSSENFSIIFIEFDESVDLDTKMMDVNEKLSLANNNLPSGVSDSTVLKLSPDMMPIMQIAINVSDANSKEANDEIVNNILPRIKGTLGVSNTTFNSTISNTIELAFIEEKVNELKSFGINIDADMITNIINAQNMESALGYVADENNKIHLVRVGSSIDTLDQLKELPIISTPNMTVLLKDLMTIEQLENTDTYSKINGENVMTISINKQNSYATSAVSKNLLKTFEDIENEYENVEIKVITNQADYIETSINSVLNNLIIGGLLAIVILFIFLRDIKPTIIIGLAIPISVVATFICIYFTGLTLNMISLGGLALGIGMLVDNAIVVIENIYRLNKEGKDASYSSIVGSGEVISAIFASTLTSICVFLPVIFIGGFIANMLGELALVIIFSLGSSLVVSLTLVPMMASRIFKNDTSKKVKKEKVGLIDKLKNTYLKMLNVVLKHNVITLIIVLLIFVGSIFVFTKLDSEYLPTTYGNELNVEIKFNDDVTYEQKTEILDEYAINIQKLDKIEDISIMYSKTTTMLSSNSISITIDSTDTDEIMEIKKEIEKVGESMNLDAAVSYSSSMMGPATSDITIEVSGYDLNILRELTIDTYNKISNIEGLINIENGINQGSTDINILVDRNYITSGVNNAIVLGTLNSMINKNTKLTNLVFDNIEYEIKLKDTSDVLKYEDLENLRINGLLLNEVSEITKVPSIDTINRKNNVRVLTITASLKDGYNLGKITEEINTILDDIETLDGYAVTIGGASSEMQSSIEALVYALLLSVLLIYMVMAAQFESYKYPFIIMFTIPLAFSGSIIALLITQTAVSATAMIGLIILMGIVVNNGIVLVDAINRNINEGKNLNDAIINASSNRFRPILMTALTTILGLVPMALAFGENGELMAPMAVTTIGGLIFATVLTLFVVPSIYKLITRKVK